MQWSVRGLRRISKADSRLVLKAFLLISSISGSARMKSFVEFYRRLGNTKSRFDANISSIESCWWQPKPLMLLQIKNFYHRACNEQSVSRRSAMSFISMMWRAQAITNTKKIPAHCFSNLLHDACGFRGFVKRVSSGKFAWQAKLLAFTSRSSYIESAKKLYDWNGDVCKLAAKNLSSRFFHRCKLALILKNYWMARRFTAVSWSICCCDKQLQLGRYASPAKNSRIVTSANGYRWLPDVHSTAKWPGTWRLETSTPTRVLR